MKRLKNVGQLITMLAMVTAGAGTANAGPISFNLSGNLGEGSPNNQLSWSSGGITLYTTAWYTNTNSFSRAALGQWSGGVGVCNDQEDGANGSNGSFPCDSPQHAADNVGQRDFVLFLFSAPVDMKTATLGWSSGDADVSYWLGNVAGPANQTGLLTGKAINNLPAGFGLRLDNDGSGTRTFNLDGVTSSFNALLIGGSLSNTADYDDYFKIQAIGVENTPVPEPASLALLGIGLAGVVVAARRRVSKHGRT